MSRIRRLRTCAIAIVFVAFAAAPATAPGAGGHELHFSLAASNDYTITVSGRGDTALMRVTRPVRSPGRAVAYSVYIARAKISATRMRADFGDRGSISVRFRPSGKVMRSKSQRGCRGTDHFTRRFGVFVGKVSFIGEDGYTSAHRQRVKGRVVSPLSPRCAGPGGPPSRRGLAMAARCEDKVTSLEASWRLGLSATSFAAINGGARKALFFATAEESVGSLAVFRLAFALGSPATFTADTALSLAGVTPPPPFSGSGSFQRNAKGVKSWTGSLAVSFPGASDVPLTGPQFKTQLIRSW